ncbi:hypothetical protein [Desulfovibrio sp. ZJ200]|uniref:hypothetical protein n=1 Tax=Desulfovibrio sp. ZJ200 TaxID=2709792 RepID=UPI0013EAF593|nr:hypothetical protein [Desulfovibrio sp. ZJ200]
MRRIVLTRPKRIRVTHYTTLSALKKLVYDESKFRLSEGNFLNDPSEGRELFNFLDPTHQMFSVDKDLTYLTDLKDLTRADYL